MNRKLLEYVYRKYGRELYLYLYSLCKEHTLAEELVQRLLQKRYYPFLMSIRIFGHGFIK